MFRNVRLLATAVLSLVFSSAARATIVYINPAVAGNADEIDGNWVVSQNPFLEAIRDDPTATSVPEARGILEFDLSTVPVASNIKITGATLQLLGSAGGKAALYGYAGNDALDVSDATQMSNFLTDSYTGSGQEYEFSFPASAVQSIIFSGAKAFGVLIYQEDAGYQAQFYGDATFGRIYDPILMVNYTTVVPEPVGPSLLLGVAGLLGMRHRRGIKAKAGNDALRGLVLT